MIQIPIQSKHGLKQLIIDDEDYDLLSKFRFHVQKGTRTFYAFTSNGIAVHKLIINSDFVDHINGNGMDNTRSNLRPCTRDQNNRNIKMSKNNKSGYKGVSFEKSRKKYVARICVNYKNIVIGRFETPKAAAKAYNEVAFREFGEFAKLNIIPEDRKLNQSTYKWTRVIENRRIRP